MDSSGNELTLLEDKGHVIRPRQSFSLPVMADLDFIPAKKAIYPSLMKTHAECSSVQMFLSVIT